MNPKIYLVLLAPLILTGCLGPDDDAQYIYQRHIDREDQMPHDSTAYAQHMKEKEQKMLADEAAELKRMDAEENE